MRTYYSQENTGAISSLAQSDGKNLGKMKMRNQFLDSENRLQLEIRGLLLSARYCFSLGYKNRSKEQILLF